MNLILPEEIKDRKTDAPRHKVAEGFRHFALYTSRVAGTPWAFALGVALVGMWALTGHIFAYSQNWQLVINTGTTIVTFLMVFLIQNTQARDSKELHLKLDELLRAIETARNTVINAADFSDEEIEKMEEELRLCAKDEQS